MPKTNNPSPKSFEFIDWKFDDKDHQAIFTYAIHFKNQDSLYFEEKITFPRNQQKACKPDLTTLNKLLNDLHLVLGLSYYKLYCPKKIILPYNLSKSQAEFWTALYRKGLGEMLYRNNLPLARVPNFKPNKKTSTNSVRLVLKEEILVGIGGGKDSIVAVELFKETKNNITAFEVVTEKSSPIIKEVIDLMAIPSIQIHRELDKKIFAHHPGSFNGHIPISAIIAFLAITNAVLNNYKYIAVANASSSNFGNLEYDGQIINHQWSKSLEFEKLIQEYIYTNISPDIIFWSPIRPFFELRVVKMLTKYPKYFSSFSSCNKNFLIHKDRPQTLWCGQCSKCAFMFNLLSAYLPKTEVINIFNQNLFDKPELLQTFRDLLGFGNLKPFDCVGPFEESQGALYLASKKFPDSLIIQKLAPLLKDPDNLVREMLSTQENTTTPTKFIFLGIESVLIAGYGKEGKSTELYLKEFYPKIKIGIADQTQGDNYLDQQKKFDLVIKTPGIPKNKITRLHTTATNIFLSQVGNLTIGVTGTKGKSTTASLIYHIIKTSGKSVKLLGNIGNPMLADLNTISKDDILVLELSSYQLDDIILPVNISLVTNLFPDHLPYHGQLKNYYEAKHNITLLQRPGDIFVYNPTIRETRSWVKDFKGISHPFIKKLNFSTKNSKLIGRHNQDNIRGAITVAKLLGISNEVCKLAIETFTPLPHRLQFIGKFKNIDFYDDAISTTPESTIQAIKSLKKIDTIMLGGTDRGYDFTELEKVVTKYKIKNIILFPDTGNRMFINNKTMNILKTTTMSEAVSFAYKYTTPGKICLLSTASPSLTLWKNFEEKGDEFVKFVKELS